MIRHLHPTDSPSLLQFKQASGQDEVFTLAQAVKGKTQSFPLMKYTSIALSPRAWQSCWVSTRRARVLAVLRAGARSGPHAWEVTDLFLAKKHREIAAEALEQIAIPAGSEGARRVFVRMPEESELLFDAQDAGYEHAYSETVYIAPSAADVVERVGAPEAALALKPLDDESDNALFRLYCAATPLGARSKTGQTMDEWASAQERLSSKGRDWVLESDAGGRLDAHVRTSEVSGDRFFSITCSQDARCGYERLIAAGVGEAGEKPAITVVRSYERGLAAALEDAGFEPHGTYDVMIKTLAVQVRKTVGAMAIAGS
jgi:hypothetical protein